MALINLLTKKQIEVLQSYLNDDWKYLILNGAVRAGKTVIDNYLFLLELKRIKQLAERKKTHTRNTFLQGIVLTQSIPTLSHQSKINLA